MEELELSCTAGENGTTTLENWQFLKKLKVHLPYDPVILFGVYLREM